jgi:hypothetical protein
MKTLAFAFATLLLASTAPVVAEDNAAATAETAEALTIDSPIETLMADERAKAIVTENMGGQDISKHPMYEQFKAMNLKALAPFSQGMITDEMIAKIDTDLASAVEPATEKPAETAGATEEGKS